MAILLQIALLSFLAGLLVFSVRFLIMPGIDKASKAMGFGSKARGKLLGYVTSAPEWVIVVSSAAMGVYDAGFWNIASSNIINWLLFLAAVFVFQQSHDLKRKATKDEIAFGIFSVALPVAIASILAGIVVILSSGYYIGDVAENLIRVSGVPAWMIGWILGLISSIPEMSGFIEIYRKYKKAGSLRGIDDTQEALDALVASNMCNLCVILPFGILIVAAL